MSFLVDLQVRRQMGLFLAAIEQVVLVQVLDGDLVHFVALLVVVG